MWAREIESNTRGRSVNQQDILIQIILENVCAIAIGNAQQIFSQR